VRLDKVIVKSVLSTLAAIGFLCLLLGSVLCVVFPQTMMGITHDMGMSGLSMHFAEVAYKRTDETYYVAFATQTAITKKDADKTEEFGEMFLTDEGFEKYAEQFVNDSANFDTVAEYRISIQNAVCAAEWSLAWQKMHRRL
jgi:hypothetical protein